MGLYWCRRGALSPSVARATSRRNLWPDAVNVKRVKKAAGSLAVEHRVKIASGTIAEADVFECVLQGFEVPCIFVLPILAEMVINVIEFGFALSRMIDFRSSVEVVVLVVRICTLVAIRCLERRC